MGLISFDLILFSVLSFIYIKLKAFKPNLFFPPNDVTIFLPPQEEEVKILRKDKESQQKNQNKYQKQKFGHVQAIKASSKTLAKSLYAGELDLSIMLSVVLTAFVILTELIKYFKIIPSIYQDGSLSFYMTLLLFIIMVSNLFKSVTMGGFRSQETKISLMIALASGVIMIILNFGFQDVFIYDFTSSFQQLNIHLHAILIDFAPDYQHSWSANKIMFIGIFICSFLIFCMTPVIVRFVNCYVAILKDVYKIQDQQFNDSGEPINEEKEENTQEDSKKEVTESNIKNNNNDANPIDKEKIRTLRIFNSCLVINLAILILYVRQAIDIFKPWQELYDSLPLVRIILLIILIVLIAYTQKFELEVQMSKAYESIRTLVSDPSQENFTAVKKRVVGYYQVILVVAYQIFTKYAIPLLLLFVVVQKSLQVTNRPTTEMMYQKTKFFSGDSINLEISNLTNPDIINQDWNCPVIRNPRLVFQMQFKCPQQQNLEIGKIILNGGVVNYKQYKSQENFSNVMKIFMKKVNQYGLIPTQLYITFFQFILFNLLLFGYIIQIIIIIFLRKTQYI